VLNGAIYLLRTALLFDPAEPSLYGDRVAAYPMPDPYGFNIDDPADWDEAERMLEAGIAR
jgi:CMP-N-acetylneuraminic acid synthetase